MKKVAYIQFLHDASELLYEEKDGDIAVSIPVKKPEQIVPILEFFLKKA